MKKLVIALMGVATIFTLTFGTVDITKEKYSSSETRMQLSDGHTGG